MEGKKTCDRCHRTLSLYHFRIVRKAKGINRRLFHHECFNCEYKGRKLVEL